MKTLIKALAVFLVFFTGTCCILQLDAICEQTTGEGGKLVLDVANWRVFQ